MRPRLLTLLLVLGALTLTGTLAGSPSLAHTALRSATPADGEQLRELPGAVTLTFTGDLQDAYATVAVTAPDGAALAAGDAAVAGTTVTQPLAGATDPAVGAYVVAYRVVADDGHPLVGELSFEVSGTGAEPTGGALELVAEEDDAGWGPRTGTLVAALAASFVLAVALAVALAVLAGRSARRRTRDRA